MALWGKTDISANAPKYVKLNDDGSIAQDASGKKLVLIDNEEAALAENKAKGISSAGWYLIQTVGDRTRVELLIALSDAPRSDEEGVLDDSDSVESDAGLANPE